MLDCIPNTQSKFHPEDDSSNLSYNTVPDTDSFTPTLSSPENPFPYHSHKGCVSPIIDNQHCAGARNSIESDRMEALSPAQPKSLLKEDLQLSIDTRQNRRREQNRIAYVLFLFVYKLSLWKHVLMGSYV